MMLAARNILNKASFRELYSAQLRRYARASCQPNRIASRNRVDRGDTQPDTIGAKAHRGVTVGDNRTPSPEIADAGLAMAYAYQMAHVKLAA
jgi:hypothetical protein